MRRKKQMRQRGMMAAAIIVVILAMILIVRLLAYANTEKEEPKVVEAEPISIEVVPEEEPETIIMSKDWGYEDAEILTKIAMAEAEGESTEGKALVMLVVLNRVWSDGFPDTIHDVVFEKGQFSPVKEGGRYWTTEPDEDCFRALELIERGWDESEGALYFEATTNGDNTWHSRNLEYIKTVGGHNFYK